MTCKMDDDSKFGIETERALSEYDLYGMSITQLSDMEYNEICKQPLDEDEE